MDSIHSIDYKVAAQQIITPVAPAAGNNYALPFLPLGRYHLLSVHCIFQASIAVANRFITLSVLNGILPVVNIPYYPAIPATSALALSWSAGNQAAPIALNASLLNDTGMGPDVMIDGFLVIQINVANIQAADQLANIRIVYRSWPHTFYIF